MKMTSMSASITWRPKLKMKRKSCSLLPPPIWTLETFLLRTRTRTGTSTLPRTYHPTSRVKSRMRAFKKCRPSTIWELQGSTQTRYKTLMKCTFHQPHLLQGCQQSKRIKRRRASREAGSLIITLVTLIRL